MGTQIDLLVLDNKTQAQSVAVHPAKQLPLRLGVLIDSSNSERGSSLYQAGVQGISDLLSQLLKTPEDKAFVIGFSSVPEVSEFMNRDELLRYKINLTPGGGTALYDAVFVACAERVQSDLTQPARRVLVVLSDGDDNMSHVTPKETITVAQRTGTVIFGVSTSERPSGFLGGDPSLKAFADRTGGQAFLHLSRKELPKVFSSIREQIENMYVVSFVPASVGKPGEYHSIELRTASDTKAKLRAPKGYYFGATAP